MTSYTPIKNKAIDIKPDTKKFRGIFVGKGHTGKTVAACSFPHPILVLDCDMRIGGIDGADWVDKNDIDVISYPPKIGANSQIIALFERLNHDFEQLLNECNAGSCKYKTLILDSLSAEAFGLLLDALPMTHPNSNKGRFIGNMKMAGPEDYSYESTGTQQIMAFLRSLPIPNIIVSAHIVPVWGKEDPDNPMSNTIEIGEALAIRPKIGAVIPIYFDHIFKFSRRMVGKTESFFAEFRGNLANTAFKNLPSGEIDITGKDFYKIMMEKAMPDKYIGVGK